MGEGRALGHQTFVSPPSVPSTAYDERSSPELAALHSHLQELRISASTLESSLQNLYQSPHLSLRVIQKLGAAIHVQTRSKGAALISVDRNASLVAKSGSTQAFTLPVRPSFDRKGLTLYQAWVTLYSKIVSASTAIRDHETEALRVLTSRVSFPLLAILD